MCEFSSIPPDCPKTIASLQYGNLFCSCPTSLTFIHTENCAFAVRAGIAYCFDPEPDCPTTHYATSYQMCCFGCSAPIWEVTMGTPDSRLHLEESLNGLTCQLKVDAKDTQRNGNPVPGKGGGI